MGNGNSRGARKHKNGGRRGFPSGTFPARRVRALPAGVAATKAPGGYNPHGGRGGW